MTRTTTFVLSAIALSAVSSFAFATGCNTAQVTAAAPEDGGSGYCQTSAAIIECDAAAVTVGCVPDPDSGIPTTADLPPNTYPLSCKVISYSINVTTGECGVSKECTCDSNDAGPDGGSRWICL